MAITTTIDRFLNKKKYRAYREVFNLDSSTSHIVLKDMCQAHEVFNGGFDPDPYKNAFNSGERNAVLRILTILNLTYEDIIDLAERED